MGPPRTDLTATFYSRSEVILLLGGLTFTVLLVAFITIPATAAISDGTTTAYQYDDTNPASLESGTTYWQGWTVTFDATQILSSPDSASEQERTFQIRRVTDDNQIGNQLGSFTVDQSGQVTFDLTGYTGKVAVVYSGDIVHVENGVGYTSNTPDGTTPTASNSAWSTVRQDLDTSLTKDAVYDEEHTTLTLISDRSIYTVGVASPDLTFNQLVQIFPNSTFASNYDAQKNDSVLLLTGREQVDAQLNFTNITPGAYDLEFTVTDTTGYASPVVTVKQPNQNAHFETVETAPHAGDSFTATIACDDCYVILGNAEDGVIDLLRVQDQSGDGLVSLTVNTRYAGLDTSGPGAPTGVDAYSAGPDSVTVFRSSDTLSTGRTLGNVRSDLSLSTNGLDSPLSPGNYELTVSTTTHLRAHPPNNPEVLTMRDTADVTTVSLQHPTLDSIESLASPPGFLDDLTPANLPDRTALRDEIVLRDLLILRIDVSGVHGYLAVDGNNDPSSLRTNENEGFNLQIKGTDAEIDPVDSRSRLLSDPASGNLYLVLDTRRLRGVQQDVTPGEYTATFTVTGIDSSQERYSVNPPEANWRGFPYVSPGDSMTAQTTFSLIEPADSTTFAMFENTEVRVPDQSGAPVQGTSKLSPSSEFTVTAEADGWTTDSVATVDENGTWKTTLDFSAASPDQTFTITAERAGDQLGSASGIVVPASEFTTPVPPSEESTNSSSSDQSSQSSNTDQVEPSGGSGILSMIPGLSLFSGLIGKIVLGAAGVTVVLGVMITVFRLLRG